MKRVLVKNVRPVSASAAGAVLVVAAVAIVVTVAVEAVAAAVIANVTDGVPGLICEGQGNLPFWFYGGLSFSSGGPPSPLSYMAPSC
jgi:hypothetical protein